MIIYFNLPWTYGVVGGSGSLCFSTLFTKDSGTTCLSLVSVKEVFSFIDDFATVPGIIE